MNRNGDQSRSGSNDKRNRDTPWIRDDPTRAVLARFKSLRQETPNRFLPGCLAWQYKLPEEQSHVVLRSDLRSCSPDIYTDVVMISAGCEEERSGKPPRHLVQTKPVMVEARCLAEISDIEMNVPHHGSGRHTVPRASRRTKQVFKVERLNDRDELAVVVYPLFAGTISVDLDADSIRIDQIQSFAAKVIGRTSTCTDSLQMRDEAAEMGPCGQQQCEMVEPKTLAAGERFDSGKMLQLHQHRIGTTRAELDKPVLRLRIGDWFQTQCFGVVLEGPVQITDGQSYFTDRTSGVRPEGGRFSG